MAMTNEQENHLADIKATFEALVDLKYRKGQAEHGGDLMDMEILKLVDCALDEAIDQVVYLTTLKNRLMELGPDILEALQD